GDGGGAEEIFENEVPPDDPGDELTERRVAVGVRAAGDRNHRGELGVAEASEQASKSGEHERQNDRRTGVLRRGGSRPNEDARANDRPDAKQGEIERAEGTSERDLPAFGRRLSLQLGDTLLGPQTHR